MTNTAAVKAMKRSAVLSLQADCLDDSIPVSRLLRTAKVIATKLDQQDALHWIDRELDGYMGTDGSDLPSYRSLRGELKAFNPYYGWQTVSFEASDKNTADYYLMAPIGSSISSLESAPKRGDAAFALSPERRHKIESSLSYHAEVQLFLSANHLAAIPDAVRNLILNWTLNLEKAGILGEEMTFTNEEKKEAQPATAQWVIQNLSVLGNVSGNASVEINQTSGLDLSAVRDFLGQAFGAIPSVPENIRSDLKAALDEVQSEVSSDKPDHGKVRSLLRSTKSIAEGATGSLVASGIGALIAKLLGG